MSDSPPEAVREVAVPNPEGLHARPVMRFVDIASTFRAKVSVTNVSRSGRDTVDGKSAMQMMLLEATQGNTLRIEAKGEDALAAVDALAGLVAGGFKVS